MSALPYTTDTSDEAHAVQMGILRRMSPGERFQLCNRFSTEMKELAVGAIRRLHPELNNDEVQFRFIESQYGLKLANQLKAWKQSEQNHSRSK